ncbi:putative Major facilitator superfamily (MFS) profile domain-containing protein [Seiridium unicorne]|uniref:Major facilitator superfamily (MFS) profile domain-containing protein n=1 Tax=Seiridium unicorne TaxID=138068 RepID=A0ABR2V9X0_9PEZI
MASLEQSGGVAATVHHEKLAAAKSGEGDDDLHHIKALEQVVQSARAGAEKEQKLTLITGHQTGAYPRELIGLTPNGCVSELIRYRLTVIRSLSLLVCWMAIFLTAQNVQTLVAS